MQSKTRIINSIIRAKLEKKPYKLNLAVTAKCNSRCKTCNVWQKYRQNPQIAKKDLTSQEIDKIFSRLPRSFVWLSLSGGEPFLRSDIVKICQSAVLNMPSLALISIPTNGLLGDQIITKVKQIMDLPLPNLFINFSLDGPEKIHDYVRGVKGGFQKTWHTYHKLLDLAAKHKTLNVNIETTISGYNIDYLEGFFKDLLAHGHKITITIAHSGYLYKNIQGKKEYTKLNNHGRKLKKIISQINQDLSYRAPTELVERIYLNNILHYYKKPKKQPFPCLAMKYSIAMDSQGNITPCFMWGEKVGNIKDYNYDMKKMWQKKQSKINTLRHTIINEKCPNCWTPCEAYQAIINRFISRKFYTLYSSLR
jgi:radical SAM protein with 4Fe4S-binding SPASM domain